jgi:hypothetical protein
MKAKEFIPASKPRNFVAKNQKTAGAGKHKDKKKAEKQGQVKHKGQIAEGSEQVYKVIAVDKSNALGRKVKLNVKADSVDEVFERLAMSDWYPLSINGEEVIDGRRLKPGVQEGSYTTEKQIKTRIRQIMYDRKLSGTESNAGELHRLKQQLKDIRSQQDVEEDSAWGEPREILEDVLQTLEREVEWPLTEVMDPKEVRQLLSPIVRAVNDKMMSMEEGRRDYGYDDFGNSLRPGDDEGEPVSYRDKPKGMWFYNVPAGKDLEAKSIGLKQTKSGKWYSRNQSTVADMKFGQGRYWEPK